LYSYGIIVVLILLFGKSTKIFMKRFYLMKILTVLGARPQFIKAGPVSREIKRLRSEGVNIEEIIVHTGQHYDRNMSDVFFEELQLPIPDYYLGVGGKSHGAMTGEMIIKLEEVMFKEKPDVVLVYGDTNSTLAGAITASKLHVPIAHVEAGLRSFNMNMPEEINRVLTDRLSKWLFCPTDTAVENLKKEGFENFDCRIVKSGDVMYDAVLFYRKYGKKPKLDFDMQPLSFVLVTVHRAENTDDEKRLKNIIEALEEISREIPVIFPVHPRTRQKLRRYNICTDSPSLHIIEPVSYLEMVWLLDNCKLVMTDSGGLQKEAYFFKKPCITLRDETEWIELVDIGANVLVGADKERIVNVACESEKVFEKFYSSLSQNTITNLYGDGKASEKIINRLLK